MLVEQVEKRTGGTNRQDMSGAEASKPVVTLRVVGEVAKATRGTVEGFQIGRGADGVFVPANALSARECMILNRAASEGLRARVIGVRDADGVLDPDDVDIMNVSHARGPAGLRTFCWTDLNQGGDRVFRYTTMSINGGPGILAVTTNSSTSKLVVAHIYNGATGVQEEFVAMRRTVLELLTIP